jgi:hypothetical protein
MVMPLLLSMPVDASVEIELEALLHPIWVGTPYPLALGRLVNSPALYSILEADDSEEVQAQVLQPSFQVLANPVESMGEYSIRQAVHHSLSEQKALREFMHRT